MHDQQLQIDLSVATNLAAHVGYAGLEIRSVASDGTAHRMFRVGEQFVLRLPLQTKSRADVLREHDVLRRLAPHLSCEVPRPVLVGDPTPSYNSAWSMMSWVDGAPAATCSFSSAAMTKSIAHLLAELAVVRADDAWPPSASSYGRGVPLAERDSMTRGALNAARDLVDTAPLFEVWESALAASPNASAGWLHGDLASGNIIVRDGRLAGVIDFTSAAVGDPACDLSVAWELFDEVERARFRRMTAPNDATWARARGWALSTAIVALPYYVGRNKFMVQQAHRKLAAVLV